MVADPFSSYTNLSLFNCRHNVCGEGKWRYHQVSYRCQSMQNISKLEMQFPRRSVLMQWHRKILIFRGDKLHADIEQYYHSCLLSTFLVVTKCAHVFLSQRGPLEPFSCLDKIHKTKSMQMCVH